MASVTRVAFNTSYCVSLLQLLVIASCIFTISLREETGRHDGGMTKMLAHAQSTTTTAVTKTICQIPLPDVVGASLHGHFAMQLYQAKYSAVQWKYKLLGNLSTREDVTAQVAVVAWVRQGDAQCDVLIGPGFSFLAIALSPLVLIPWVCFFATAVELSDKNAHPTFSRVIPNDEIGAGGAAAVMRQFGWLRINTFCADEPYGRSVVAGAALELSKYGGFVEVSRCVESSASRERVREALNAFLQSETRVVFVGLLPGATVYHHLRNLTLEMGADKHLLFFFSEALCSIDDRTYLNFTGALCATYASANSSKTADFLKKYEERDITWDKAALSNLGYNPLNVSFTDSTIVSLLAHDAVHHVMSGIHQYYTSEKPTQTVSREIETERLITYLRHQHMSEGLTGTVKMTNTGDRPEVSMAVYNAHPGSQEVTLGLIVDGKFVRDPNKKLYLAGQFVESVSEIASVAIKSEGKGSTNVAGLVAGLVAGAIVLATGAVGASLYLAPKTRNNAAAPKDGNLPFTIVFTDIQSSTMLWALIPEEMSDAVSAHHDIIRGQIEVFKGYEVKTIGDAFMVAFQETQEAVDFAVAVEEKLYEAKWDPHFEGIYAKITKHGIFCNEGESSTNSEYKSIDPKDFLPDEKYISLWHGLRVRIGVNCGLGAIQFDPTTLAYDYYGTVVNTAARVESVGHGGQIVITEEVMRALPGGEVHSSPETIPPSRTKSRRKSTEATSLEAASNAWVRVYSNKFECTCLGAQPLRGLSHPTLLYQILPLRFRERSFPPLRVDEQEAAVAEADMGSSIMSITGVVESSTNSPRGPLCRGATLEIAGPQSIREHAEFLKVLFSTCNEKQRTKELKFFCQKWHVDVRDEKHLKGEEENKYMEVLSTLGKRILSTMNEATYVQGGGQFRSFGSHSLPMTSVVPHASTACHHDFGYGSDYESSMELNSSMSRNNPGGVRSLLEMTITDPHCPSPQEHSQKVLVEASPLVELRKAEERQE